MATLYHVANMVGSNRVLKAEATTHPLGNQTITPDKEKVLRYTYIEKALEILTKGIQEKSVYSVN